MALMHSNQTPVGERAPDFDLPSVDGKNYSLSSFAGADVVVVIFTCNHCPYAIAVEDRLVAIQADYLDKGVRFVAINPNDAQNYPADSFKAMKVRAKEKNFNFPYLVDETQEVARAYDAACTPDLFVLNKNRTVLFNTRIDDNWQEPEKVTHRDLRLLLDTVLNAPADDSVKPSFEVKPSMGCSIKWKN